MLHCSIFMLCSVFRSLALKLVSVFAHQPRLACCVALFMSNTPAGFEAAADQPAI
tara:strand:- start:730 stop:894 length:165 start_codon:yes stop_codon:yes gene_type:complete